MPAAPWLAPTNPYDLAQVSVLDSHLPPGTETMDGRVFWLGTDGAGRDLYSAILYGLRVSLAVGVSSAFIALLVGMTIGLVAAYAGGRTEALIMRIVDVQLSFPAILIALILLALLGKGVDKIVIALVVAQWAYYARTVRGSALVERSKEYVEAARMTGEADRNIMFMHILPNCFAPLVVRLSLDFASAILTESSLSFLGLGFPPPTPSWGLMLKEVSPFLELQPWAAFVPGLTISIMILGFNLLGDGLRDVFDPRQYER